MAKASRLPLAAAAVTCVRAASASPVPTELLAHLPSGRLLGEGRLRFFGLPIYDARLWITEGFEPAHFSAARFALELRYLRALEGRQIAQRSLDEMGRGGALPTDQSSRWLAYMTRTFPNVSSGDCIHGVNLAEQGVRFVINGQAAPAFADPVFAHRFFGIWLAPTTSQPKLRSQLLGLHT